jgi:hypothetical protein
MGSLPRNTVAKTIEYIAVVLCNKHIFTVPLQLVALSTHTAAVILKSASYWLVGLFLQILLYRRI